MSAPDLALVLDLAPPTQERDDDPTPAVAHPRSERAKRGLDVLLAATLLLLTLPLLVTIAVAVKLDSPGPAIFRQRRLGRHGRDFVMFKFRTMTVGAEAAIIDLRDRNEVDGPLFKIRDDPRITRTGQLLRRLSLDELPQLVNVLRGDMSLVGPRPALAQEAAAWPPGVRRRLAVKPGITGLWQVSGRSTLTFAEYVELDLEYVEHWTLRRDVSILLRTIPAVVRSCGAY